MKRYDPNRAPDPAAWLALDEDGRLALVRGAHVGDSLGDERRDTLHGTIHVVVETRLADDEPLTTAAFERLVAAGVDRHSAIHALGSVVAEHIVRSLRDRTPYDPVQEAKAFDAIDPKAWLRRRS